MAVVVLVERLLRVVVESESDLTEVAAAAVPKVPVAAVPEVPVAAALEVPELDSRRAAAVVEVEASVAWLEVHLDAQCLAQQLHWHWRPRLLLHWAPGPVETRQDVPPTRPS